jgi:hypothetical protein
MRMTEGDLVKITVINSKDSKHPHSLHMHSIHSSYMDGVEGAGGVIAPGQNFTYAFIAQPYGVYPYHFLIRTALNPNQPRVIYYDHLANLESSFALPITFSTPP